MLAGLHLPSIYQKTMSRLVASMMKEDQNIVRTLQISEDLVNRKKRWALPGGTIRTTTEQLSNTRSHQNPALTHKCSKT